MTSLIISSIIALLVIAGVALFVARWLKACEERELLIKRMQSFSFDASKAAEAMLNFARAMEAVKDSVAQERLLNEAKEILKQTEHGS